MFGNDNFNSEKETQYLSQKNSINSYATSVGELINIKSVITALNRFLVVTTNRNLNYEYKSEEDTRLVFITGWDEDEKDIPIWDYPLPFKDSKGNETVAVDLRKYLNKAIPGKQIMNLNDVVRDRTGFDYTIINTLITNELVNGNFGKFKTIEKTYVSGYAMWVSFSLANTIMLSLDEKLLVEIVSQHFMYCKLMSGKITIDDVNRSSADIVQDIGKFSAVTKAYYSG